MDDNGVAMTLESTRIFEVEYAGKQCAKKGERSCGDAMGVTESREEYFYGFICDGMGSGREADITANIGKTFLEKMLSCGNSKSTTLDMLNMFISNKSRECSSTVDLLEIDLLHGKASFTKSGAAASYVIREGKLFRIASTSLPIGITREIASEEIRFGIKDGDLIVMISDGVSQSFEDGVWLLTMLSEELDPDAPANVIAGSILDRARKNNGRSDDMTVIAVKVEIEG
jgi:stage II sporulation protein E